MFFRSLTLALFLMPAVASAASVLYRGAGLEPETLDPQLVQSLEAGNVVRDLYEGLVREGPAGEALPGVAESWSVSEDGLTYEFRLRERARWCNGRRVTADEVAAGLRRNFDLREGGVNPKRWALLAGADKYIEGERSSSALGVEVLSENRLVLQLAYPAPYLLHLLHHPSAYPVPIDHPEPTAACPGGKISNGAYVLESRDLHEAIRLVKNSAYWDRQAVEIERVVYRPIADPDAELAQFRAGQLHITAGLPPGRVEWAREHLPLELRIAPLAATYFYGVNLKDRSLGKDPRVRQALSLAIDRELLVEKVTAGGEVAASTLVPPGLPDGYQPPVPAEYTLDMPTRRRLARSLLEEADVRSDEFRPTLLYNEGAIHARVAQAIQAMWAEAFGVKVNLERVEWKVLLARRKHGATELFRDGWAADYPDPLSFLAIASSSDPNNTFGYTSRAFDLAIDAAQGEIDVAERKKALRAAEEILLRDLPLIPIYHYTSKHLVSARVEGWRDNATDHHLSRYLRLRPVESP